MTPKPLLISTEPYIALASQNFTSNEDYNLYFDEVELIDMDDVPENVIPVYFDDIESACEYIELEEQMSEQGKSLDLSPVDIIEYYNEDNGTIDFSDVDISELEYSSNNNTSETLNQLSLSGNTKTLKKTFSGLFCDINVYATITLGSGKFTKPVSVKSTLTGVTIGLSWKQIAATKVFKNDGKTFKTTVTGTMSRYILVKTDLLKIGASDESYTASWNY